MNFRTPVMILFGSITTAVALAVLALAANTTSYVNSNRDSTVDVHYTKWNETAEAQYSYWVKLDYAPSRFTLVKERAEIATGALCAVFGLSIAVGAWMFRGQKVSQADGKLKKHFLTAASVLSSLAFVIALALTAFTWQSPMKWPINFKNSLPLPPTVSDPGAKGPTTYQSPFPYTPEVWNCLLYPYVVGPESVKMQNLCQQAHGAKYLMVPLVVVSGFLVGICAWYMWQSKKNTSDEVEMVEAKDVDAVSVETASVEAKN